MNTDEKNYITELQKLNLTEVEARAYYNLLINDLTAAGLSQILNLNRSYAYGLLKKLITMGLCIEIKDTVRKYRAVEPESVFSSMIDDHKKQIEIIQKLSTKFTTLYQSRGHNLSNEIVKVLYSKASVLSTLNRLEDQAQEEILAFSKAPYIMNIEKLNQTGKSQKESLERGVKHKTIYELESGNESHYKMMEFFMGAGEEVRIAEFLPMKLVIFDSKIVVFTLEKKPNKNADCTFTSFDDTVMARTFKLVFQTYWDSAITLDEYLKK